MLTLKAKWQYFSSAENKQPSACVLLPGHQPLFMPGVWRLAGNE